jgi:hypothetical protein
VVSHLGNRTANFHKKKQRQLGKKQTGNETKLIPMDRWAHVPRLQSQRAAAASCPNAQTVFCRQFSGYGSVRSERELQCSGQWLRSVPHCPPHRVHPVAPGNSLQNEWSPPTEDKSRSCAARRRPCLRQQIRIVMKRQPTISSSPPQSFRSCGCWHSTLGAETHSVITTTTSPFRLPPPPQRRGLYGYTERS